MDLIFNLPYDDRWDAAYKKLGLTEHGFLPRLVMPEIKHANDYGL
jgi:putative AlgH/UPF0301 family transcriptional regulator